MFLPNFDRDTVDAPGRRKDGRGGRGRGRRTAAGLLALGGWCTGRASCLFSCTFGRHFLKRGGLVVVLFQDPIFDGFLIQRIGGVDEGA